MPAIKQLDGPGVDGGEDSAPMFKIKFTQEEFTDFLADPTSAVKNLGYNVNHLTVTLSDGVWMSEEKRWGRLDRPTSKRVIITCGVMDEACWCWRVIGSSADAGS
jgi:hypothetical protein